VKEAPHVGATVESLLVFDHQVVHLLQPLFHLTKVFLGQSTLLLVLSNAIPTAIFTHSVVVPPEPLPVSVDVAFGSLLVFELVVLPFLGPFVIILGQLFAIFGDLLPIWILVPQCLALSHTECVVHGPPALPSSVSLEVTFDHQVSPGAAAHVSLPPFKAFNNDTDDPLAPPLPSPDVPLDTLVLAGTSLCESTLPLAREPDPPSDPRDCTTGVSHHSIEGVAPCLATPWLSAMAGVTPFDPSLDIEFEGMVPEPPETTYHAIVRPTLVFGLPEGLPPSRSPPAIPLGLPAPIMAHSVDDPPVPSVPIVPVRAATFQFAKDVTGAIVDAAILSVDSGPVMTPLLPQ